MSRVIKVRVWNPIGHEWLFPNPKMEDWFGGSKNAINLWCYQDTGLGVHGLSADSTIIEEWTGLKDSQGQDIYEGDLVTFQRWDNDTILRGPVWWDTEAAAWAFGRYIHQHCDEPFEWGYPATKIRDGSAKVVGNIRENNDFK